MGLTSHRYTSFVPVWFIILAAALVGLYYVGFYTFYIDLNIFSETWMSILFFCVVFMSAEVIYCTLYHCRRVKPISEAEMNWNRIATKTRTVCIIPCHKAAAGISPVLETVTKIFEPQNVWIADNSNLPSPPDNLREIAESFGVRYLYYPLGNKTNAMYEALKEAKQDNPRIEYVVFLDDDTVLQESFFVRTDLFLEDDHLAGYCPNIVIQKSPPWNMWEYAVDMEYRMISFHNATTGHYHTVKFLHGIVCVYRVDRAMVLFEMNACNDWGLPYGEDALAGLQARSYNWSLAQDELNTAFTFCPRTAFFSDGREQGFGAASLFKQRCLRWYTSWPRRVAREIVIFFSYDAGSLIGNITQRMETVYYFYLCIIMTIWPYFLIKITFFGSDNAFAVWGWLHFFLFLTAMFTGVCRNFGMPKALRVEWQSTLLYPILASFCSYLYGISFLVCLFYFIPFVQDERKQFNRGWRDWIDEEESSMKKSSTKILSVKDVEGVTVAVGIMGGDFIQVEERNEEDEDELQVTVSVPFSITLPSSAGALGS
eukprot:TRINITY_DN10717_c0_g3_i2.p1 TRINITY_DN10717_c0_g3~~TRINITY_DN10717_c0_g3_i2.p1  ORF type:complete len:541 (-),score=121.51 TRINITY_DN10717_c0_g3_i2:97-1719(-)